MAEYLSPGVYVEEIEIGAKPIEGVSTSTAGFIGVAEKGPLNKPTLVVSFGEYLKVFGGYLDKNTFKNVWYLPYAVQGFFENGGKRVYITRVASKSADKSTGFIPDISGSEQSLAGDVNSKEIMIKLNEVAGLTENDILLIKEDKKFEFVKYKSPAKQVTLNRSINSSYPENTEMTRLKTTVPASTISMAIEAGTSEFDVDDASGFVPNDVLFIDDGDQDEICIIKEINNKTITVQKSLQYGHDGSGAAINIEKLINSTTSTPILSNIKPGYNSIPIIQTDNDFKLDAKIKIGDEYFIIKSVDSDNIILIEEELKYAHAENTLIKKLVSAVNLTASSEGSWGDKIKVSTQRSTPVKISATGHGTNYIDLETVSGIYKGTILKLDASNFGEVEEVINTPESKRVILASDLPAGFDDVNPIETEEFDLIISFNGTEEVFSNLSLSAEHPNYVKNIKSKFITVDLNTNGAPNPVVMPSQDNTSKWYWKLTGGNDGIPGSGDIDTVYEGKPSDEPKKRTGLYSFKNIDGINIVAVPGITSQHIQNKIISHCEEMADRFGVLDPVKDATLDDIQKQRNFYDSKYAALYYPWVKVFNPLNKKNEPVPPSGQVIGVYARSDVERGVHKAPANEKLNGVIDLGQIITKGQQDVLNPKGVNCIRSFPGRGIRVWGARTLSSDPSWKYINVRRLFLYLEESIDEGTQWVVFEPNSEILWARVIQTINNFLKGVWKSGALMGLTPEEAFFVKCDRTTMTQDDIDNGRLIVMIGVAPVKPAEFVIFRIAQWTNNAE